MSSTPAQDFREAFLFHLAHGQSSSCYGRLHYAQADILLAFETAAKAVKPVSTSGDQVEGKAAADEALTVDRSVKAEGLTAGETAQPAADKPRYVILPDLPLDVYEAPDADTHALIAECPTVVQAKLVRDALNRSAAVEGLVKA